jgi:hypothetical protein
MFELELFLRELAAEFKRRGMTKHLAQLRRFYAARRRRALAQATDDPRAWTEDLVLSWLGALRIGPFAHLFALRGKQERCACGASATTNAFVECAFPGGYLWACRACGAKWLVQDGGD